MVRALRKAIASSIDASGQAESTHNPHDATETLRNTEERDRLAARATDDVIIWDWDLATDEIRWNEALTRRFGHAPDGLVTPVEWREARVHPDERPHVLASIDSAIEGTSDAWSAEYRFERADGSYANVLDHGYLIRSDSGQAVRMVGAIMDWTERKLTEERLRESEENYRYTVELSPQLAWTADPDGGCIHFKRRPAEAYKLPAPAGDLPQLIHPDDAAYQQREWESSVRSGKPYDVEYRVRSASGDYRWVRSRGYPRYDENGRIVRWYGVVEDIHEHRTAKMQLQQLQDELAQVARVSAMGTLASTLAHELNQPLTTIANYMAGCKHLLAGRGPAAIDAVKEAIDNAGKAAVQAGEIVRRLRDLVSQGKVDKQRIDLAALVKDACNVALADMREKKIGLKIDISSDAQIAFADRVQVQQVLVNLLRNAAEAVANSQYRLISVTIAPHCAEQIVARIEDSGPGVPPEVKRHLFSPFISTKTGGMGVGLSISRSIVEAHGGEIWVEDAPGGGAAFCFTLPRAASTNFSSDSAAS